MSAHHQSAGGARVVLVVRLGGISGLLAMVALVIWGYTLLMGQAGASWIGTIGDVSLTLECACALPVAVWQYRAGAGSRRATRLAMLLLGGVGLGSLIIAQALHLMHRIGLGREAPIAFVAILLIGLWLGVASALGRRAGTIFPGAAWIGLLACLGSCILLVSAGVLAAQVTSFSGHTLKQHSGLVLAATLGLLLFGAAFASWLLVIDPMRVAPPIAHESPVAHHIG